MDSDNVLLPTNEVLESIIKDLKDVVPEEFFRENLFFAGGCIRSLINKETPNDYDVFLKDSSKLEELKSFLSGKFLYSSINSTGIKLPGNRDIQFITCATGSPEEIISEFDFIMNMNYYDPKSLELQISYAVFDKKLRVNCKCRNILGTLARIPKFVARGFEVPDSQDLVTLGIRASKMEPITKVSQLVSHCRLASCVSDSVVENNQLERDFDTNSLEITLRGSGVA